MNSLRFRTIRTEEWFTIVYDFETKVQYAVSTGSYNRGILTMLVDSEGKPLLYK